MVGKDKDAKVKLDGIKKLLNSQAMNRESLTVGAVPGIGCGEILPEMDGREVTVGGWAQEVRNLGGVAFAILRDGTGEVQATFQKEIGKPFKKIGKLNRESVVVVRGTVKRTDQSARGVEVLVSELSVYSKAQTPLPMGVVDRVNIELDTRLDNRFIDLRRPEIQGIFRIRSTFLSATREYLESMDFTEVHSPKIVAAATEGGTDLFPMKYFDREAYLNQSPQLYKQILMATGLDRVYEIGAAFRAEPHDTTRHLNEFTSIDIEMCYADHHRVMDLLEGITKHATARIGERNRRELDLLGIELPDAGYDFPRLTYSRVLELLDEAGAGIEWGEDIGMEEIRNLVSSDTRFAGYYYIIDWPTEAKPFYAMPDPDRPEISRTFDLMFAEKEITSGAQRVHDHNLLLEQLKARRLKPTDFEFYVNAFRYGMPPHAGWGLGAERMVMILTGGHNIRECVLFPRDRQRLVP